VAGRMRRSRRPIIARRRPSSFGRRVARFFSGLTRSSRPRCPRRRCHRRDGVDAEDPASLQVSGMTVATRASWPTSPATWAMSVPWGTTRAADRRARPRRWRRGHAHPAGCATRDGAAVGWPSSCGARGGRGNRSATQDGGADGGLSAAGLPHP
jgi:hypothetical protein